MNQEGGMYPWHPFWIRQRVQERRSGTMQKIIIEIQLFVCNNILGRRGNKQVPAQLDMYSFIPNAYERIPLTCKIQTAYEVTMRK